MTAVASVPATVFVLMFARPATLERLAGAREFVTALQSSGVHVVLLGEGDIMKYSKPFDPVHPLATLPGLSRCHRADYFRAYLMHHYGGGVAEPLPPSASWNSSFAMFKDPEVWAVGVESGTPSTRCSEDYRRFLGLTESCGAILRASTTGNFSFAGPETLIARRGTPMTHAWLRATKWRLDYRQSELRAHPSPYPYCCVNRTNADTQAYPMQWTELRDDLFAPLLFKYHTHARRGLPSTAAVTAAMMAAAANVSNLPAALRHHHRDSQHGGEGEHNRPLGLPRLNASMLRPPHVVTSTSHGYGSHTVPVMVWVVWLGPPMRGARLRGLQQLERSVGVQVRLVTEDDFPMINKSHDPIHPAVTSGTMSRIQQGDYVRAYLMHHYGGGYHDVKPTTANWTSSFQRFTDPALWVFGVQEINGGVACGGDYLAHLGVTASCHDVGSQWKNMVSNGAYIMRPGTPLTEAWLRAANWRLDHKFEQLKQHPAPFARCCLGLTDAKSRAYPLRWAELHGEIFHPLQYKFLVHVQPGLPHWAGGAYRDATEGLTADRSNTVINAAHVLH
mmetsp:Transcript_17943/g.53155  ORF Transcript_17943/g.53155 Transcript_17943/m.53155 type:complete len:561 (+) Transcript_17943:68-1750(+)|eukprot:CAMPEP_0206286926 /NCGR_PEP_ID=MMETSP0106_2-20121207/849_1 /ASSEMBLY_ACC=CAM_ASM_000206 /TAXON_ID=81532 /ORGANISM="Acanthoeca-like sp., Strain 10tr" /LENGTH=560 /DNA_ID=CAMNT_0053717457 /DNA_START=59 /DNA_END=1741 /DNA_ORIENTATION=-